jgi:copper chaperone CopZ
MRHAIWVMALFLAAGCAYTPQPLPDDGPRVTMMVHGIACSGCAREVHEMLMRVPGVAAVAVDRHQGRVTLVVSETAPPTDEQLTAAVQRSGKYRVIAVQRS